MSTEVATQTEGSTMLDRILHTAKQNGVDVDTLAPGMYQPEKEVVNEEKEPEHGNPELEGKGEEAKPAPQETEEEQEPAATGDEVESAEEATTEEKPGYELDRAYKANGEEKELEDWVVPLIGDKETEDKMKELFSKSDGIDGMEERLSKRNDEYTALKTEGHKVDNVLNYAAKLAGEGLMLQSLQALGIKPDKIEKFAEQVYNYSEMSPEERQAFDTQQSSQASLIKSEFEKTAMNSRNQEMQEKQASHNIDIGLAKPGVIDAAAEYDERVGAKGSFKRFVTQEGERLMGDNPQVTIQQAVDSSIKMLGLGSKPATPTQSATPAAKPRAANKPVVVTRKPSIPKGKGSQYAKCRKTCKEHTRP